MIEKYIAEMLEKKLEDGSIEKVIEEKLTKCIGECMDDMFRWNGQAKKLIEDKLKEVMVPAIEGHSFSEYTLKLDAVLTEIINTTSLQDNKKILENFKELMIEDVKEINLSSVFKKWSKYVEENVKTDGLEVIFDDGPEYESVHIEMEIEDIEKRSIYSPKRKVVSFICEHDEDMNLQFEIYKYDFMKGYEVSGYDIANINSLRNLDDVQLLLMKLGRNSTKITIDENYLEDEITPSQEPEASFS